MTSSKTHSPLKEKEKRKRKRKDRFRRLTLQKAVIYSTLQVHAVLKNRLLWLKRQLLFANVSWYGTFTASSLARVDLGLYVALIAFGEE